MAKKTKKVKIAGRLGSHYGSTVRKKWNSIMTKRIKIYDCPSCLKTGIIRESVGIWKCKKCNFTFAGGAYEPRIQSI